MGEIGKVLSEANSDGTVKISMKRSEACAKCRVCVVGLAETEMLMEARNLCGAKIGDMVEVELRSGYFVRASLIMYGIPLLALLFGAWAGSVLLGGYWGFALGMAMMVISYLIIGKTEKTKDRKNYMPMAVAVAEKNNEEKI